MLNKQKIITTLAIATASPVMAAPSADVLSTVTYYQEFSPRLNVETGSSSSPYSDGYLTSIVESKGNNFGYSKTVDVIDKIKALKVALGLSNTAVSDILQITRQSLHSYLNTPGYDKNIHPKTLVRAIELEKVTQLIQQYLDRSPSALAKNISVNGDSLFDLLKKDQLEFDKIELVLNHLAEKMSPSGKEVPFNQQTLRDLTSST